MSAWAEGYVTEIGYTHGYYTELNPARIRLAFLASGLNPPEIATACELGYGQGISVNVHAAASDVAWHGTDFNPSHAAFARSLAQASGSSAMLFDESFLEFCRRSDLPDFDYIGLHGIWSWISDDNRAVIVDFLRRKLKVGGVLYISYNALPGWSAMAPLRHLLAEHAGTFGAPGQGVLNKIGESLNFAETFLGVKPTWLRAQPQAAERFSTIKGQNRNYLAHEYFNRDWQPMYVSDMANWLAPAKLSFACSAHVTDLVDGVNLTAEQRKLIGSVSDPVFRETLRDYTVNQQFRRDYWVRGPVKLDSHAAAEQLGQLRLMQISHRPDIPLTVQGALGEGNLNAEIYTPILDLMADHRPRSLAQMAAALAPAGVQPAHLREAALLLAGSGVFVVVQDDAAIAKAKRGAQALNGNLMARARANGDIKVLASPVSGGGFSVNRFQQLFLAAIREGRKTVPEWVDSVWSILRRQEQLIVKNGETLTEEADNRAELESQAIAFRDKMLPSLKALQVG